MPPDLPTLQLTPVGIVHSPWNAKHSAPRQPSEARGVEGRIELLAGGEYEHAVEDLESWSHIWVLFWFHLNTTWHAKVSPPRSTQKRGVFATRSPHRPNPIGISVLELVRVEGRIIHVRDLDLLDQTPVLDIKPYVAYSDSVPQANAGWLEVPEDTTRDTAPTYQVEFAERAIAQLAWLKPRIAFDLEAQTRQVLALGPAPHAYRRIRVFAQHSRLALKDFRLYFRAEGRLLRVFEIETGYRARVLADPHAVAKDATPLAVHRDYVAEFGPLHV